MESLLDSATIIPIAVVVARLVVPLFIPRLSAPGDPGRDGARRRRPDDLHGDAGLRPRGLPDLRQGPRHLLPRHRLRLDDRELGAAARPSGSGRFLWYYRLVGVALFESTGARWLLFVFPNTFEYFFDAIEAFRISRNPIRLTMRAVIGIAAFIWIFIKLPQEWWIHIAQLDFTDFMKETVFGVPATSSWTDAIAASPMVAVGLVVAARGADRPRVVGGTALPAAG